MARSPLVSHASFCFSCSHICKWRWRKRIRAPASSEWVCGRTYLPAHSYRMKGEDAPSVQAVQSHVCTCWMRLLGGWTASALHSMAVLLVFQAKMLASEEAGLAAASLRDLRCVTDLALHTTKATAQVVLECHLWLTMTEMKEVDKAPLLDAPVSSGSLFGPAVEGFAERFTEAQKSSQAMQHFLPKRTSSSAASSRPKPAPTQQTAKPTAATPEHRPPEGWWERGRLCSAWRYPFPKYQGPWPKIALDPAPRGLLQGRYHPFAQSFPEYAGPYGNGFACTSFGYASHATHPVLAEAEGSIHGLASQTPPRNGDSGLSISPSPLEGPLLANARRDPRHGSQKEGCHDRRFQQGLGSAVWGQTDLQSLVWRGVGPAHQLHRNASSVSGLSILPARHSGTPCASTLRQQVRGVIHKSSGRPRLEATLHAGERPSSVSSEQPALMCDACAGQNEPRSRHVVEEQCLFRGMDAPPARGSENLGSLWQSTSRPLCLWRQLSLPNLFYKNHEYPGPRMAQPSVLYFPPSLSATADTQANQGTTAQADSKSPLFSPPILAGYGGLHSHWLAHHRHALVSFLIL